MAGTSGSSATAGAGRVAIFLLGALTCGQGSPDRGTASKVCGGLGALALVLAVAAVAAGSLTVLSLLVTDIVVLWAVSRLRHVLRVQAA
jgi:hypothetical protein